MSARGLSLATKTPPAPPRMVSVAQLMTAEQLSAWLNVSVKTIYEWVQKRRVPFRKLGPKDLPSGPRAQDCRPVRFDYNEIEEWQRTGALPEWFVK